MKIFKLVILLFVLLLSLTGCLAVSINGFYAKDDLTQDERIAGNWSQVLDSNSDSNTEKKILLLFEKSGEYDYHLALTEGEKTNPFVAYFFKLNGQLYMDLYPQLDTIQEINSYFSSHLVKAHSIAKIELTDENLKMVFMDSDNLKKIIIRKKVKSEYAVLTENDDQILLTGPTEEIRNLIVKNQAELFTNKPMEFTKTKSE